MNTHVYILTWCQQIENLYGTSLVFKTLRVGFPNAIIHVIDNASIPAVRPTLQQLARDCEAIFVQMEDPIVHYRFIEYHLARQWQGSAIFVDPDICFWENVEGWHFDRLMAGRLIPKYHCEFSQCLTHPRLHTSLLWVSDVIALRHALENLKNQYFEFNPFRPMMFKLNETWQRFDTGANLYAALPEQMQAWGEPELEAYDHLFCGTHLDTVLSKIRPDYAEFFQKMHQYIQTDYRVLKGAWRMQEEYFRVLSA